MARNASLKSILSTLNLSDIAQIFKGVIFGGMIMAVTTQISRETGETRYYLHVFDNHENVIRKINVTRCSDILDLIEAYGKEQVVGSYIVMSVNIMTMPTNQNVYLVQPSLVYTSLEQEE